LGLSSRTDRLNLLSVSAPPTVDSGQAEELRLEPVEDFEAIAGEWRSLAARSRNLFATPEWAATWWRHFGDGRRLLLTACRDADGRIVAILPLYLTRDRPVRIVRFLGHGAGDELGPVCDVNQPQLGAAVLRRALRERLWGWDVFLGERMSGSSPWSALLDGDPIRREANPVLYTGGRSWDDFLAEQSSNFREQMRRRERKLAREHDLCYRLSDRDSLEQDFESLLRLHRARWGEEGSVEFARARDFHRDFAAQALDCGWLRLWVMEVNGGPVAAWYGFRFQGAEYYYQAGRDPAWDRYSIGFVLLAHTMRETFNDGLDEYRLLRGGEQYKDRFANGDQGLETMIVCRGLAGRAALAAARVMPSRGKRFLAKIVG
jgi:CelD/BcsL family acetyltransferase involved in cellulose biosynthesis